MCYSYMRLSYVNKSDYVGGSSCSCCQVPEAADMVEEQVQDDVVMKKLFIRGLSNEATKEQVQEFFERYGNVRRCFFS